jgi:hypothetical protein
MCFSVDPVHGMKARDTFHSVGLNQTTPPSGPPNTVSHVLFSPDGLKLRASVKNPPSSSGFLAEWDVAPDGTLSSSFTKTSPPSGEGLSPFGMINLDVIGAKDAALVADPGLGLTVYDFSKPTTTFHPLTIPGQTATCWVEYSTASSSFWLSDVESNRIYEVSVNHKTLQPTLLNEFDLADTNNPTDIAIGTVLGKQ